MLHGRTGGDFNCSWSVGEVRAALDNDLLVSALLNSSAGSRWPDGVKAVADLTVYDLCPALCLERKELSGCILPPHAALSQVQYTWVAGVQPPDSPLLGSTARSVDGDEDGNCPAGGRIHSVSQCVDASIALGLPWGGQEHAVGVVAARALPPGLTQNHWLSSLPGCYYCSTATCGSFAGVWYNHAPSGEGGAPTRTATASQTPLCRVGASDAALAVAAASAWPVWTVGAGVALLIVVLGGLAYRGLLFGPRRKRTSIWGSQLVEISKPLGMRVGYSMGTSTFATTTPLPVPPLLTPSAPTPFCGVASTTAPTGVLPPALAKEPTPLAPSSSEEPIPTKEIALLSVLGQGGMGIVYGGSWLGTPVAVKVLAGRRRGERGHGCSRGQSTHERAGLREGLMREAAMLAQLRHPYVCRYFGATVLDGSMAIVLECLHGGSVATLSRRAASESEKLGTSLLCRIACETASGIAYLHRKGLMHRDVKADNVLLDEVLHAKVTDFGLAKLSQSSWQGQDAPTDDDSGSSSSRSTPPLVEHSHGVGTPRYLAPETHSQAYDERCDVYSFGLLLWEMLHGIAPFASIRGVQVPTLVGAGERPPVSLVGDRAPFKVLIEACWQQDPSARPTMEIIAVALQARMEGLLPITLPSWHAEPAAAAAAAASAAAAACRSQVPSTQSSSPRSEVPRPILVPILREREKDTTSGSRDCKDGSKDSNGSQVYFAMAPVNRRDSAAATHTNSPGGAAVAAKSQMEYADALNSLVATTVQHVRQTGQQIAPTLPGIRPKPGLALRVISRPAVMTERHWRADDIEAAFNKPLSEELRESRIDPSRLRLLNVIGHGSFASVYDARWQEARQHESTPEAANSSNSDLSGSGDEDDGHGSRIPTPPPPPRRVAVKVLHSNMITAESLDSFKRSAEVELRLAPHPNIVALHGWSVAPDNGRVMLAMEYVGGGSLASRISSGVSARWHEEVILSVASDIASAVSFLHSQNPPMVHRDIKPENILFTELSSVAKLADFGSSRAIDGSSMTKFAVGTMLFASPEQLQYHSYNAAVDVWAMGCVLACIARGQVVPCDEAAARSGSESVIAKIISGDLKPSAPPGHCLGTFVNACCRDAKDRPTATTILERLSSKLRGDGE